MPQRTLKESQSFTVGTTGYASERLTLAPYNAGTNDGANASPDKPVALESVAALVKSAVTAAVLELWLPKHNSTGASGDYFYSGISSTSGFLAADLRGWAGAEIRVKSGGTSGTETVDATGVLKNY